MTKVKDV